MDAEKIALTLPDDEVRAEAGFIAQIKAEAWRAGFDACKEQAAEVADDWMQYGEPGTAEWMRAGNMLGKVRDAIRALEPKP